MKIWRLLIETYSTPFNKTLAIRWLTDAGLEAWHRRKADEISKRISKHALPPEPASAGSIARTDGVRRGS